MLTSAKINNVVQTTTCLPNVSDKYVDHTPIDLAGRARLDPQRDRTTLQRLTLTRTDENLHALEGGIIVGKNQPDETHVLLRPPRRRVRVMPHSRLLF